MEKTSEKAVNIILSLGTVFSIGIGLLYYSNLIFNGIHFLYISFGIFVILSIFVLAYSLFATKADEPKTIEIEKIKVSSGVKIAWGALILIMIVLYNVFN